MKYFFLLLLGTSLAACNMNDKTASASKPAADNTEVAANTDSTNLTTIEWIDPVTLDLGSLKKGQVVELSWKFKNTGNKPLTITSVSAGCGCTTPDPPKEPIAPGEEGVIRAKFNSENFNGRVNKEVYVQANNSNRNNGGDNKLSFTADIKE